MNDRFKYRVWDEEDKKYVSEFVFINHHGELCVIEHGRFFRHKCTVEQCTGLKDKNDKLIYEGDVFEATVLNSFDGDEMLGKRIRGQVAYYVDEAAFTFAAYSPINLSALEIIGNIHEKETEQCKK